jgi:hypothetical protein
MFLHLTKSALDYSFLPLINSKLKARSGEPEIFALTPSNFQMFSTVSFKRNDFEIVARCYAVRLP